jgi:hypothetical protein
VLSFRYRVIQLNRLNWRDFLRKPSPIAAALMTKMKIAPQDRPRLMLECLRMIVTLKLDLARSALIRDFMASYLRLTAQQKAEYNEQVNVLDPAEKRPIVALIDMWSEKRLYADVVLLLEHKFGALPTSTRNAIDALAAETLEKLLVAVLEFSRMDDVNAWLAQHER